MTFNEWLKNADMPQQYRLPQYFGKRVAFSETKRGDILIRIENSAKCLIGETIVTKAEFLEICPHSKVCRKDAVAWACQQCGFNLEDSPEPIRAKPVTACVVLVDSL